QDDAVDRLRFHPGVGQGAPRGGQGQVAAGGLAVGCHVAPLLHAGAGADPLVAGFDGALGAALVPLIEEGQLAVIDDALGNVGAKPKDGGADHGDLSGSNRVRGARGTLENVHRLRSPGTRPRPPSPWHETSRPRPPSPWTGEEGGSRALVAD